MRSLLMYLYGDLSTDARVLRTAEALSATFDVEIVADDIVDSTKYKVTILDKKKADGIMGYFANVASFLKYVKKKRFDVLYANDYYSALPALYAKKNTICNKLVYDAHELFIPQPNKQMSLRDRFFYYFEKKMIHMADLVIAAQSDRARIMKDHYQLNEIPITIRNVSVFYPNLSINLLTKEQNEELETFFKVSKKTIVYAGVLATDRGLNQLCGIVEDFSDQVKLLLIGDGPARGQIESVLSKSRIDYCFIGKLPYSSMQYVLRHCDIGFIFYANDCYNNIYSASNKVFEYMSCGLTILSNDNIGVKKELNIYSTGIATNDLSKGLSLILHDYSKFSNKNSQIDFSKIVNEEMQKLVSGIEQMLRG